MNVKMKKEGFFKLTYIKKIKIQTEYNLYIAFYITTFSLVYFTLNF